MVVQTTFAAIAHAVERITIRRWVDTNNEEQKEHGAEELTGKISDWELSDSLRAIHTLSIAKQ